LHDSIFVAIDNLLGDLFSNDNDFVIGSRAAQVPLSASLYSWRCCSSCDSKGRTRGMTNKGIRRR
jgi:hypothetical protein